MVIDSDISISVDTLNGDDVITGENNIQDFNVGDGIALGAGNDTITLGTGADNISAGAGNDIITAEASLANTDIIDGGAGTDTLTTTAGISNSSSSEFSSSVSNTFKLASFALISTLIEKAVL